MACAAVFKAEHGVLRKPSCGPSLRMLCHVPCHCMLDDKSCDSSAPCRLSFCGMLWSCSCMRCARQQLVDQDVLSCMPSTYSPCSLLGFADC